MSNVVRWNYALKLTAENWREKMRYVSVEVEGDKFIITNIYPPLSSGTFYCRTLDDEIVYMNPTLGDIAEKPVPADDVPWPLYDVGDTLVVVFRKKFYDFCCNLSSVKK